jgi:hypothetical protein
VKILTASMSLIVAGRVPSAYGISYLCMLWTLSHHVRHSPACAVKKCIVYATCATVLLFNSPACAVLIGHAWWLHRAAAANCIVPLSALCLCHCRTPTRKPLVAWHVGWCTGLMVGQHACCPDVQWEVCSSVQLGFAIVKEVMKIFPVDLRSDLLH